MMKPKLSHCLTLSILAAFALLLVTTGCSKTSSGVSNSLTASFSGVTFQPYTVYAADQSSVMGMVGLQIRNGDSIGVVISFLDTVTVNSPFDFTAGEIEYVDEKGTFDFDSQNPPSHGFIKVTSWDKTKLNIAGTFSGVLYDISGLDSTVVTGGQFSTTYQSL
jgi:type 1 fimbria pilin